jgi:hypothetical protein
VADFRILGEILELETLAESNAIRELARLVTVHGFGRWRKRKGVAEVETASGAIRRVELRWYEAHGIGSVEMKIKRYLD